MTLESDLKKSLIHDISLRIACGRAYTATQERRRNPNIPSPLDYAKGVLYDAHTALLDIDIPETPFQTAEEVYNYIALKLSSHQPPQPPHLAQEQEDRDYIDHMSAYVYDRKGPTSPIISPRRG
jgi:hypothetical protein